MPELREVRKSNCDHCELEFTPRTKTSRFCSRKCKDSWNHSYEKRRDYVVEYRGRNPKNYLKSLKCHKKQRKDLSIEFLEGLYNKQEGKCAISGVVMTHIYGQGKTPTNISIDRIDSSKEYSEDNVQLVCYTVNIMKNTLTLEELKDWCKLIISGDDRQN